MLYAIWLIFNMLNLVVPAFKYVLFINYISYWHHSISRHNINLIINGCISANTEFEYKNFTASFMHNWYIKFIIPSFC